MTTSRPSAIGRSKWLPSFARSAGARFTVIRFGGSASPIAASDARTRSRLSPHRLVGQAHDREARHPGAELHLDVDLGRLQPEERHGAHARDREGGHLRHARTPPLP
jgi:hypothetical protein